MALFESYERRIDKINGVLAQYGISSVEECREICQAKGFDPYEIVKGIQPICFENACWAYTVGAAIALKNRLRNRYNDTDSNLISEEDRAIIRQNLIPVCLLSPLHIQTICGLSDQSVLNLVGVAVEEVAGVLPPSFLHA